VADGSLPAVPGEADRRLLGPAAIDAGYTAAARDLGRFNLGLFGITGAGKSTLLNAVFGADLAATGIGAPVTQASTLYRYQSASLGIFDTKGLELGSGMADILRELATFVDDNRLGPEADQLHVIWYCVRAGDRRIQPAEADFIRKVAAIGIPVILVMTQTPLTSDGAIHPEAAELAAAMRELKLPIRGDVFFVNALADAFAGVGVHGLDELLDWTSALAPEGVRNALAAAQRVNRRIKAQRAESVVSAATERVRMKSFVPRRLGETWVTMFAEIATIYEIPEELSREVLDTADTTPRLRRLVYASNVGALLMPTVALAGAAASAATNATRQAFESRRRRRAATDRAMSPTSLPAGSPGLELAQTAAGDKPNAGWGWGASRTTRTLGQAWAATCEHFWSQSYPEPPTGVAAEAMATYFADELQRRLPVVLRTRESRRNRRRS
jgi:GTP-binding protein EngB required for normal cell division